MSSQLSCGRWRQLLSSQRLGQNAHSSAPPPGRTEFDRDYDRIVFSEPFRSLQDKTQVFPFSPSDYTRTRLTHSLEVSCVGRSLGQLAGEHLIATGAMPDGVAPADIGFIVAAACLAHDLGNPPFGHAGEDAIQGWAARQIEQQSLLQDWSKSQRADFTAFEGNAQTFRILTHLLGRERRGGLRLTVATLGTLLKYPRPSWIDDEVKARYGRDVALRKFNYFQAETELALEVCGATGMTERAPGVYARHPLSLLMEAADDICYAVVDLEDAYRLGLLSFGEVRDLLRPLGYDGAADPAKSDEEETVIVMLRSFAITGLTQACIEAWRDNLPAIEAGTFADNLVSQSKYNEAYRQLKTVASARVYTDERVLLVEYAGYQTLGGLLDFFYEAVVARSEALRDHKLRRLLPVGSLRFGAQHHDTPEAYLENLTAYERLLCVTDYVSGLTDRRAVDLYQKLSGIKLPG